MIEFDLIYGKGDLKHQALHATISEWRDRTDRWRETPHRKENESAFRLLAAGERALTTCPVCGWNGLHGKPYQRWPGLPVPEDAAPPYADHFGAASYEVCESCGFEFGFDDQPGAGEGVSFEEFRAAWIAGGCSWWFHRRQAPAGWDGFDQLRRAGLST